MKPRIAIPVPRGTEAGRYANYFETLQALGAVPARIDADTDPAGFAGLLLPGGVDVAPERYGQQDVACGAVDRELDALQFAALDAFVKAVKPVFGVCRGHQIVNVRFGGTLFQSLPQWPRHKWDEATNADRAHDTDAIPGSWLAGIYGQRFSVNSAHHQGVDALGEGLVVDQRADDGVIEAMHHIALPVWCVQWHPERMCLLHARSDTVDGGGVIAWFIRRCAE